MKRNAVIPWPICDPWKRLVEESGVPYEVEDGKTYFDWPQGLSCLADRDVSVYPMVIQ